MEEWVFQVSDSSELSLSRCQDVVIPGTPKVSLLVSSSPKGPPKNEDTFCSRERIEAPLPPLQPRPTCERLELPFSGVAILSDFEDLVSSGSDHFTMWGKLSHQEILAEQVVDIHKVVADFRDAFERIQSSSSQTHGVNKYFSSQSPAQRRLSIYNWNPGPRRGKEDAFEKQIAGKWHIITLQEASEYVEHEILHERFLVTHFAGCAILFNKDTFYPDISVKSIYLHDTRRIVQDHIVEGEQGWVLQGVLSRASFRRAAASGQKLFTVLSLHISNIYAKTKGIAMKIIQTIRAMMISQNIDLVAGDFNGTSWRCRSRDNISTIDEVFSDCALPTPPGTTPLWGPGSIPNNWADVCGFLMPPGSQLFFWKVNKHGAFFHSSTVIMRRGFICSSSIGITSGTIRLTTTGTFASRNDQRVLEIELKNVASVKFGATIRSRRERATTCASWFLRFPLLIITK